SESFPVSEVSCVVRLHQSSLEAALKLAGQRATLAQSLAFRSHEAAAPARVSVVSKPMPLNGVGDEAFALLNVTRSPNGATSSFAIATVRAGSAWAQIVVIPAGNALDPTVVRPLAARLAQRMSATPRLRLPIASP